MVRIIPSLLPIRPPPRSPLPAAGGSSVLRVAPLPTPSTVKTSAVATPSTAAKYRACLRNRTASVGGHVVDSCGEFMPGGDAGTPTERSREELNTGKAAGSTQRAEFRTKFTAEQKGQMLEFAERLGWRIHRQDEAAVEQFCTEVRVRRQVLKVWMHNNKHTLRKPQPPPPLS